MVATGAGGDFGVEIVFQFERTMAGIISLLHLL